MGTPPGPPPRPQPQLPAGTIATVDTDSRGRTSTQATGRRAQEADLTGQVRRTPRHAGPAPEPSSPQLPRPRPGGERARPPGPVSPRRPHRPRRESRATEHCDRAHSRDCGAPGSARPGSGRSQATSCSRGLHLCLSVNHPDPAILKPRAPPPPSLRHFLYPRPTLSPRC